MKSGGSPSGVEQAAAISDDEDEEQDAVGTKPALPVHAQQGANQQHRGPGGADEGRHDATDGQQDGVVPGVARMSPAR